MDSSEAMFKARMRALAQKGGAATKRRYGNDPRYYREVGRLGGRASVASRKAKIAATLGTAPIAEAAILEPVDTPLQTPRVNVRRRITISDLRADRERFGPYCTEVSERQRILDAIAHEHLARAIAQALEPEPEPFDPWS